MYPALNLRMQARIGPQLVMTSRVLRASAAEVEQIVLQEVERNPALELVRGMEERSSAGLHASNNYSSHHCGVEDWENLDERLAERLTEIEKLESQVALYVEKEDRQLALMLLYSLDEHGYLREPLPELAARTGVGQERLERIVKALHGLEPPGIGARDLRECLLIQCAHLQEEEVECSLPSRILEEAWEDFAGRRLSRVARRLGTSLAEVEAAAHFITHNLYPFPLRLLPECSGGEEPPFLPDLVIHRQENGSLATYRLEIPGEETYELRLSGQYDRLLHGKGTSRSGLSPRDRDWVRAQADLARQFIAAMEQRWGTLRRIGEFLMAYQAGFLEGGARRLKPITRAAVAEALNLHESTVSRAISDKIVQLPDGRLRPLDDLFDDSLPVKDAIQRLISAARRPLSDREIAERLQAEGLEVARRTIAKYRGQLSIPNRYNRQTA